MPFGQSVLIKYAVKYRLISFGVDKQTASNVAEVIGLISAVSTLDIIAGNLALMNAAYKDGRPDDIIDIIIDIIGEILNAAGEHLLGSEISKFEKIPYQLDIPKQNTIEVEEIDNITFNAINRSDLYIICETCLWDDEEYEYDWKLTKKGNIKCLCCGEKNDFASCYKCNNQLFRETSKGNFRCSECDKKLKP